MSENVKAKSVKSTSKNGEVSKKRKAGFRKIFGDNLYLLKLCFKAAPIYTILSIIEIIRNELVVFLEFTFGLNYVWNVRSTEDRLRTRQSFFADCWHL